MTNDVKSVSDIMDLLQGRRKKVTVILKSPTLYAFLVLSI